MATFVTMKWSRSENRRRNRAEYTSAHVNNIKKMLEKSQRSPFRMVCLCDDGAGLDDDIEVVPLPAEVRSMVEIPGQNLGKLYLYSRQFRNAIGESFIFLDLDVVVLGDMTDLFDFPEDLGILPGTAMWRGPVGSVLDEVGLPKKRGLRQIGALFSRVPIGALARFVSRGYGRWSRYNSSFLLVKADVDYRLWEDLPPPQHVLRIIEERGLVGTDQAWVQVGYTGSIRVLGPETGMWRHRQLKQRQMRRELTGRRGWSPPGLRLVIFPGLANQKPWTLPTGKFPWVDELYPRG